MLIFVINILGRVVVLDDLVLHNAHTGFFHGHFRQRYTLLVGGGGGGEEDLVDLLLSVGGEDPLGLADLLHLGDQGVHAVHNHGFRGLFLFFHY